MYLVLLGREDVIGVTFYIDRVFYKTWNILESDTLVVNTTLIEGQSGFWILQTIKNFKNILPIAELLYYFLSHKVFEIIIPH